MKKIKYVILFIVVDIITLCFGTHMFFYGLRSLINHPSSGGYDIPQGAALIVLYFLVRIWKKEYRKRNSEK